MPETAIKHRVLGFCAAGSNVGKTTLITTLLPLLRQHGLTVSVVKHAHHTFDLDIPGKDSYKIRQSGAYQTLVCSEQRWALITESAHTHHHTDSSLDMLIRQLDPHHNDLVLLEGFRQEAVPKIEVHRPELGHALLAPDDPNVLAIACSQPVDYPLPQLPLQKPEQVVQFILGWLKQSYSRKHSS